MNTGLIILAAGNSVRFGSKKLLHITDGKEMFRHTLDTAYKTHIPTVVVTQYDEICDYAKSLGFDCVINRNPERGLSSSVILGTEHFKDMDALIFAVCDQPYLRSETILKLCDEFYKSELGIARLTDGTRPGNPVIFDIKYKENLLNLKGDTGGREIVKSHLDDVLYVKADERELIDIDYNT